MGTGSGRAAVTEIMAEGKYGSRLCWGIISGVCFVGGLIMVIVPCALGGCSKAGECHRVGATSFLGGCEKGFDKTTCYAKRSCKGFDNDETSCIKYNCRWQSTTNSITKRTTTVCAEDCYDLKINTQSTDCTLVKPSGSCAWRYYNGKTTCYATITENDSSRHKNRLCKIDECIYGGLPSAAFFAMLFIGIGLLI